MAEQPRVYDGDGKPVPPAVGGVVPPSGTVAIPPPDRWAAIEAAARAVVSRQAREILSGEAFKAVDVTLEGPYEPTPWWDAEVVLGVHAPDATPEEAAAVMESVAQAFRDMGWADVRPLENGK